jgi:hypothetical protein
MAKIYSTPIAQVKKTKKEEPEPVAVPEPVAETEQPPAKKVKTEKQIAAAEARKIKAAEKRQALAEEKKRREEEEAIAAKAKEDQLAAKKALAAEKRRLKREQKQETTPAPSEEEPLSNKHVEKMVEAALHAKHTSEGERVAKKVVKHEARQMVTQALSDPEIRSKVERSQITGEQRLLKLMFPGRRW